MDEAAEFERRVAAILGGARVERGIHTSAPDVVGVPGWPELRVECKLRRTHSVNRWARETVERYGGVPCVITAERGSDVAYATVPLSILVRLLIEERVASQSMTSGHGREGTPMTTRQDGK